MNKFPWQAERYLKLSMKEIVVDPSISILDFLRRCGEIQALILEYVHDTFKYPLPRCPLNRIQHGERKDRNLASDGPRRREARAKDSLSRRTRRSNHLSAAAQENAGRGMRQMPLSRERGRRRRGWRWRWRRRRRRRRRIYFYYFWGVRKKKKISRK